MRYKVAMAVGLCAFTLFAAMVLATTAGAQPSQPVAGSPPLASAAPSVAASAPRQPVGPKGPASVQALRLVYLGRPECPDQTAFIAQVLARTPRVRFVTEGGPAELVRVNLDPKDGRYVGQVALDESVPRYVSGDLCADVVSALALIAALSADPSAQTGELGPPAEGVENSAADARAAGPSSSSSVRSDRHDPAEAPAERDPSPGGIGVSSQGLSRASTGLPREPLRWFWGAGARLDATRGGESNAATLWGPSAWLEAGVRVRGVWAPALRLGARYGVSGTISPGVGAARLSLEAFRADLCPLRLDWGSVAVVPCVSLEAGSIIGTGQRITPIVRAWEERRPWIALVQGVVLQLRIAHPVVLLVSGEIREPLRRYAFVFQSPNAEIARISSFEVAGAVGAAVHFR